MNFLSSGEEVEEEGDGAESGNKDEPFGWLIARIWMVWWRRGRVDRDHARVELGTVWWNIGPRRKRRPGLQILLEIHGYDEENLK